MAKTSEGLSNFHSFWTCVCSRPSSQVTESLIGSSHFCSIIAAEDLPPGKVKRLTQGHRAKYVSYRNKFWSPECSSFSRNYMDMRIPRAEKTPLGPRGYPLRALCTHLGFPVGEP